MRKLKITCMTPNNRAYQGEKMLREGALKAVGDIVSTVVTAHNKFYWIVEVDDKRFNEIPLKLAKAEVQIKKFYRTFITVIGRANHLIGKADWTSKMVTNWIIKKWVKIYGTKEKYPDNLKDKDDTQLKEYLKINDKKEFEEFLEENMFVIEVLE